MIAPESHHERDRNGTNMSNDLIHEIEESIKQERLEKLWKEYGPYLIASIVLAVLFTALLTGWRGWNHKINANQTSAVIMALDKEDQVAALEEISAGLRPNQRAVSYLTAAGLLIRDGRNEQALQQYQSAAADRNIKPLFRDLAQLMAVRLEWSMAAPDMDARMLLSTLQPLMENKKSPWQWHAHIQAAVIQAHAYDNFAAARDHLAVIATAQNLPRSLQERAKALDHVYALKMAAAEKKRAAAPAQEEPEG